MRHTLTKLRVLPFVKIIAILALVMSVAAPFTAPYLQNDLASRGISNSYLSQYSETITVGKAFDNFFSDPKWESYKIGSKEYVDFTGGCIYLDEPATMTITFRYFSDSFKVDNIAVDGIDMPELFWSGFLEVIYSG